MGKTSRIYFSISRWFLRSQTTRIVKISKHCLLNVLDILSYTTLTNFSMNYLMVCKVYTDIGGIKQLYHVCPPVRKIIHSLKLVDYLHVQADNPWYNYYIAPQTQFPYFFCWVYH